MARVEQTPAITLLMKSIHPVRLALAFLTLTAASAFAQNPAPAPAVAPANSAEPEVTAEAAAAQAPSAASAPLLPPSNILPTPEGGTPAASTLTGSLEAGRVASIIQTRELDQRDELLKELAERVAAADRRIAELRESASSLDDEGRRNLENATAQYEKMKSALQQSMENARSVENQQWDRARARLASDYAFYVSSVGSMEIALPN